MAAALVAQRFRAAFGADPHVVASAPGRVNLVGEHTDYNDGFVLPMTIDRRLFVAASPATPADRAPQVAGTLLAHDSDAQQRSASYVNGILRAMRREHPGILALDAWLDGDLPVGAGLASSAALAIAYARALCAANSVGWDPIPIARLAQEGETQALGVQCGIMDQAAAAAGRKGCAMLLDCRSLTITWVPMPESIAVVVMDTGTRRTLGETAYNERRASCEAAVAKVRETNPAVRALRDVTPEDLDRATLDDVTRRRARHVVAENQRPAAMVRALSLGDGPAAGQLMNDSHASLRDLYEVSSTHLDLICDAAREHPACHGARMTGAGFGGCAIALVDAAAVDDFIASVQPRYEALTYAKSAFFVVNADDGARLEPASS